MSGKEHQEHEEGFLSLQTLIAILILLVYTVAAPLFEKYHFHYMHESGVCMIIGVIVTLLAMIINPSVNSNFNFRITWLILFNLMMKCFSLLSYPQLFLLPDTTLEPKHFSNISCTFSCMEYVVLLLPSWLLLL